MRRHVMASTLVTLALSAPALAAQTPAQGQQPRVVNGRVEPGAAGQSLDRTFRGLVDSATEPAWIGYAVPIVLGDHSMCCHGDGWMTACGLEPRESRTRVDAQSRAPVTGPVRLEGPDSMLVLFRVEQRAVQKVRTFTPDCELDAGGRTIHWIEGVAPAESVALLASLVSRDDQKRDRVTNGALAAISMHRDPSADAALIRLARQDASAKVRGEAIFWVAQRAGQKAAPEITAAIDQDPDTDVKKRAVFALSQLPNDEGVPLMIQVARTNKNPAVRKQAMFWLGQSHDPRALDFFAEVLGK
jgi:HEAT repeat protein